MKKTIVIGATILVVLCAAAAAGWSYFKYWSPQAVELATEQATKMSVDQSVPIRNAYYNGDYSGPISDLPALIAKAPTASERARLQLLLASSLMARNQAGDLAQSISLIQKIVNDYSVDPWIRATALTDIARIVPSSGLAFYVQNLTDAPFSTYLPSTGSDAQKLDTAALKILESADDTFPNSATEYLILGTYYLPALENGWIAQPDLPTTARAMQTYVLEGDSRNDQNLFSPSTILFGLTYRARALWQANLILKNKTLDEQEAAFTRIFSTAITLQKNGINMDGPIVAAAMLRARYYYADFLLQSFGTGRISDIESLLKPFGTASSSNPYVRLFSNESTPAANSRRAEAAKLAALSPEFKSYLDGLRIQLP